MPQKFTSALKAIALVAVSLALSSCRHAPTNALTCGQIANFEALTSHRFLVFGEFHGTKEVPKFIADVACNYAKRGITTVVALEYSHELEATLQSALTATTTPTQNHLAGARFWTESMRDGRSSVAMWELILALRQLNLDTGQQTTRVALFDVNESEVKAGPDGQQQREQLMANRLREIVSKAPKSSVVIALAGNIHSRNTRGTPWNKNLEPMTFLVRDLNPLTLNFAHTGGSSWNCMGTACKEFVRKDFSQGRWADKTRGIYLDEEADGHDGVFYVGTINASPPLFPVAE